VTAVLEKPETESVTEKIEISPPASWLSRAGALAVDVVFGLGVAATLGLVALTAQRGSWLALAAMIGAGAVLLAITANRLLVPSLTGWTLGRAVFGIEVVSADDEDYVPGPWLLLLRDLAHLLDTVAVFVGWLWPLWDSRNRTFADLLVGTEVRRTPGKRPDVRRITTATLAGGAVIALAAAALSYVFVFRYEQATDRARDEIADQGPRIVEQMLTYHADSMKDDFAHAQTLVTDSYRPQLVEQQHIVEKAGSANNEYYAVTNSVVSVSPDRATMLVFLQGQRGIKEQPIKFITATARVTFEKSRDGHWRVSELTVLTKPAYGKPHQ
jgi:Mce-associated membrane protein